MGIYTYDYAYACENCGWHFVLAIPVGTERPRGVHCDRCGCETAHPAPGLHGDLNKLPKQQFISER